MQMQIGCWFCVLLLLLWGCAPSVQDGSKVVIKVRDSWGTVDVMIPKNDEQPVMEEITTYFRTRRRPPILLDSVYIFDDYYDNVYVFDDYYVDEAAAPKKILFAHENAKDVLENAEVMDVIVYLAQLRDPFGVSFRRVPLDTLYIVWAKVDKSMTPPEIRCGIAEKKTSNSIIEYTLRKVGEEWVITGTSDWHFN